jgi:hypothetical protein
MLLPSVTPTTEPSPTATPSPTQTPVPAPQLRRLTEGGCCTDPFFLDGQVTFIDRPDASRAAGYYVEGLEWGAPVLVEQRMGTFLRGGAFFSYLDENQRTVVERRSDGKQWRIDTGGQPVILSPDGEQVSWSLREWQGAFDRRRTQIYWASLEGGDATKKLVATVYGGGLVAWLPGDRWLISGRRAVAEPERSLFTFNLNGGENVELMRGLNIRSSSPSPDGRWVLVTLAMEAPAERNGTWLVRTDGGEQRKVDWFGAFAWRDAGRILYFPYAPQAAAHEAWEYDIAANSSRQLTDPAVTQLRIAQGDFALSPDGRSLAFVSASDHNLWLLSLP